MSTLKRRRRRSPIQFRARLGRATISRTGITIRIFSWLSARLPWTTR